MAALDKNGLYKDMKEGELNIIGSVTDLGIDLSDEEIDINMRLGEMLYSNDYSGLQNLINDIDDALEEGDVRLVKDYILNINNLSSVRLDSTNELAEIYGRVDPKELGRRVNDALQLIKNELLGVSGLEKVKKNDIQSMQNYTLEIIKGIYNDPRTLFSANNPTTMDAVRDVVTNKKLEKTKRNSLNAMTDIFLNQTTSVGKMDIGISAVAQKAFYALTHYYGVKLLNGENISNFIFIEVPAAWGKSIVSLGPPDQRLNDASYDALLELFRTWKVVSSKEGLGHSETLYKRDKAYVKITTEDIEGNIIETFSVGTSESDLKVIPRNAFMGDLVPTIVNSSIISSSTDNAKEMMMDLINATPEVLPAYEYLLSIGVNLDDSVEILGDPLINALINVSRGDLFEKQIGVPRISALLKNKKQLAIVKNLYQDYLNRTVEESEFNRKINTLKPIFDGAEELTNLGQLLGINGGIKVEFGSPVLFKLRVENIINDALGIKPTDYNKFSLERFLIDENYAQEWIAAYDQVKINFNLLDVIHTVPHYKEMFTVPVQFKRNMQLLSKDVDIVYTIAENELSKYVIDENVLRSLLRIVNDKKILNFFILHPFTYNSNKVWKRIDNKNSTEEIVLDSPITLSTNTLDGVLTLKNYIEKYIITEIKSKYFGNGFADMLTVRTIFNPLFGERVSYIGSPFNMADPQFADMTAIIQNNFYAIQNDEIEGHSIYDWMFVYDLLVGKHSIGNSLTILLDNKLQLNNPNGIVSQWIRYVNDYDKTLSTIGSLTELTKIPDLKERFGAMFKRRDDIYDVYEEDPGQFFGGSRITRPSWAANPNLLPLFTSMNEFGSKLLYSRDKLEKAFGKGIITIKLC